MRSLLLPLALGTAAVIAALAPGTASAQQNGTSSRPNPYAPSRYGTPDGRLYTLGNSRTPDGSHYTLRSYGTPDGSHTTPSNYGTLNPGTPIPIGALLSLPGIPATGNAGSLPADTASLGNTPQVSAGTLNPAQVLAGLPSEANPTAGAPSAGNPALPVDAITMPAGFGALSGGISLANSSPTPFAPFSGYSTYSSPFGAYQATPGYGSFTPAAPPQSSFNAALRRVFPYQGY
jgi:hypothetical protein